MANDDGGSDNHSRPETKYSKKDASRAKKKAFLKRKECIKKKTMELSVLCDVKACAVIVGPDGQIETWPESRSDVREVMDLYKKDYLDNKKRKRQHDDHGSKKKRVLGGDEEGVLKNVLEKVEAKLDQVKKQIQLVKSKGQETDSGRSFVKYTTSEEPDYSFSYPASELGNPLCGGGIPPNAWPLRSSQNLCSHSNVDMLGFGNQLPGDIVSSTPGYIGVFPGNFDGMHLGPVVSSTPMSQLASLQSSQPAFSLLQQQLQMPQPSSYIDCATAPSRTEPPIFQEASFYIQAMETPCFLDYQHDEINGFGLASDQIPLSSDRCSAGCGLCDTENDSNYIDCATATTTPWFETESAFMAGVEESRQNYIDCATAPSRTESPIFQEASFYIQAMETPCFWDYQHDEINGCGLCHTENYSNYIDCATATTPPWFETQSTFMACVEESRQNYIDDQTMETPCFFGYQLDDEWGQP